MVMRSTACARVIMTVSRLLYLPEMSGPHNT